LLKSFLTRTQSELCIPSVVYQEALNRVRKRTAEANSKIDSLHRLTGGEEGFQKVKPDEVALSYEAALKVLFTDLKARVLSYPVTSHEDLVKRSMVPRKPFVESGRGYHDALIWYTLVHLIRTSSDNEDVVFISQNSKDWCEDPKGYCFHPQFTEELRSQGLAPNRLVITPDLAEFNRRYTISHLPSQKIETPAEAKPTDYAQLLIDGAELIESHLLLALPDSLRRVGGGLTTVGEFGIKQTSSDFGFGKASVAIFG
jgi:hypothetical protein